MREFVFDKPEIDLKISKKTPTQSSKQKQFYVRKPYKMHKSTLLGIESSEENNNLLFDQNT